MKLKQEFVLREIAGDYVLIPVMKQEDEFKGIISLNETGVYIWKKLEENKDTDEIIKDMLDDYEVSLEQAQNNVNEFLSNLKTLGII